MKFISSTESLEQENTGSVGPDGRAVGVVVACGLVVTALGAAEELCAESGSVHDVIAQENAIRAINGSFFKLDPYWRAQIRA